MPTKNLNAKSNTNPEKNCYTTIKTNSILTVNKFFFKLLTLFSPGSILRELFHSIGEFTQLVGLSTL